MALTGSDADAAHTEVATALECAGQLVRAALWSDSECTWALCAEDDAQSRGGRVVRSVVGDSLYDGAAGTALVLAAAYALTGQPEWRRTAIGAMTYALRTQSRNAWSQCGFYFGSVGIVWAANQVAQLCETEELRGPVRDTLRHVQTADVAKSATDLTMGLAGGIVALTSLSTQEEYGFLRGVAERWGHELVARATRSAEGWSWESHGPSARNLTGLAHGASGGGLAMIELYEATQCDLWLYAAAQAFSYENAFFSAAHGNWTDLRHRGLSALMQEARGDEALLLARSLSTPDYQSAFVNAWCHGATGISLTRLRATIVTDNPTWREEAYSAAQTVVGGSHVSDAGGECLCHGRAGRAEALDLLGHGLANEALREEARDARREVSQALRRRLERCRGDEDVNAAVDPRLMLGDAGIALHLLRANGAAAASPLLPSIWDKREKWMVGEPASMARLSASTHRQYVEAFCGIRLKALALLPAGETVERLICSWNLPEGGMTLIEERLAEAAAALPGESERALLQDASIVEHAMLEVARCMSATCDELLGDWRMRARERAGARVGMSRANACRVVSTRWDWDAVDGSEYPPLAPVVYAIGARRGKVWRRRLSRLEEGILTVIGARAHCAASMEAWRSWLYGLLRDRSEAPNAEELQSAVAALLEQGALVAIAVE